jgi:hypothetical protein
MNSFQNSPFKSNEQQLFEKSNGSFIGTDKSLSVKGNFTVDDINVRLLSGQVFRRTQVRGAVTTVSTSDYLIGVVALAVATSIGLPPPSLVGVGKTYIIKDEVGGANTTNITIRSEGEKNIDGSSSTTLNTAYQSKRFYSDGSNWFTC